MAKPQDHEKPPEVAALAKHHPRSRHRRRTVAALAILALAGVLAIGSQTTAVSSGIFGSTTAYQSDKDVEEHAEDLVKAGRQTFRFDTFGDEAFWGDTLKLHQAIAGECQRRSRSRREPEDRARRRPEGRRRRAPGRHPRRDRSRQRSTSTTRRPPSRCSG